MRYRFLSRSGSGVASGLGRKVSVESALMRDITSRRRASSPAEASRTYCSRREGSNSMAAPKIALARFQNSGLIQHQEYRSAGATAPAFHFSLRQRRLDELLQIGVVLGSRGL